eukprot:scaffold63_cov306-Pinguiococcus_pyrenoidosus.AAC.7
MCDIHKISSQFGLLFPDPGLCTTTVKVLRSCRRERRKGGGQRAVASLCSPCAHAMQIVERECRADPGTGESGLVPRVCWK